MNNNNTIELIVVPKEDDVSADWQSGSACGNFFFDRKDINEKAALLRKCALDWAAHYSKRNKQADVKWKEMQRYGALCFSAIFQDEAKYFIDALNESGTNTIIVIKHRITTLSVPWGLLCVPHEILKEPQPDKTKNNSPFLGDKYSIIIDYNHFSTNRSTNTRWSFVSAIDNKEFSDMKELLPAAEKMFANTIHSKSINVMKVGTKNSSKSRKKNHFLYVYGHSDNKNIVFKDKKDASTYTVTAKDILHENMAKKGTVIFFINSCDSIKSIDNLEKKPQMQYIGKEVICIATELPINKKFAMRFGIELIDRCVQKGESVIYAMKIMREKHFPLSLAYALYCKRDVTITPPQQLLDIKNTRDYREGLIGVNFSDLDNLYVGK